MEKDVLTIIVNYLKDHNIHAYLTETGPFIYIKMEEMRWYTELNRIDIELSNQEIRISQPTDNFGIAYIILLSHPNVLDLIVENINNRIVKYTKSSRLQILIK